MTLEFLVKALEYEACDLVFLDECGINLHMTREVGWAPKGQRLFAKKPGSYAQNYTVLGAMGWQGLGALMTVKGGTSKEVFYQFVEQVLLPTLVAGQVVVMDNLAAHKSTQVVELLGEHGIHVLYTPPYSPEWNPIEWAWSKVKTFLRREAVRELDLLEDMLVQAVNSVLPSEAQNMILACGYNPPEI